MTRFMEQARVKLVIFEVLISLISMDEDVLVAATPKLLSSMHPHSFDLSAKESRQPADALSIVSALRLSFFRGKLPTINLNLNNMLLITISNIK